MQQKIGFEKQRLLDGACGKYSIIHALLILGIPITRQDANKATNLPPILTAIIGTDEKKLKKAIRYFKCKPVEFITTNKRDFRTKLDGLLKRGCPVILSFQGYNHWAVICGKKNKGDYFYIDSADYKLISYYDWDSMIEDIDNDKYYLIGVEPNDSGILNYSLVHNFTSVEKILNRGDNLYQWWGFYLEDLMEIFDCPSKHKKEITAKDFFHNHGGMIYKVSKYFSYYFDDKLMKWEYENYRTVARAHNLTLSKDKLNEAIAKFSAALTLVASR